MPSLIQTTAPYAEPLSLTEAKLFLRIDQDAEDALIAALIAAARERAELHTQRQLITAGYTFTTCAPDADARVYLPKPPLQSVASVQYVDPAGSTVRTADPSTYRVATGTEPGYIVFTTLPAADPAREDALRVTFTAGYGYQEDVPAGIKTAMKWMIAGAYANREEANAPGDSSVDRLLNLYRVWR